MGRAWTFAKVWQYFHKVWIMQGPTSFSLLFIYSYYHATHHSFVSWPQPNTNNTLVIMHSKEGFSLCIWTYMSPNGRLVHPLKKERSIHRSHAKPSSFEFKKNLTSTLNILLLLLLLLILVFSQFFLIFFSKNKVFVKGK